MPSCLPPKSEVFGPLASLPPRVVVVVVDEREAAIALFLFARSSSSRMPPPDLASIRAATLRMAREAAQSPPRRRSSLLPKGTSPAPAPVEPTAEPNSQFMTGTKALFAREQTSQRYARRAGGEVPLGRVAPPRARRASRALATHAHRRRGRRDPGVPRPPTGLVRPVERRRVQPPMARRVGRRADEGVATGGPEAGAHARVAAGRGVGGVARVAGAALNRRWGGGKGTRKRRTRAARIIPRPTSQPRATDESPTTPPATLAECGGLSFALRTPR